MITSRGSWPPAGDPEISATGKLRARALASTGPAYEVIQNVGEAGLYAAAVEHARGRLRDGVPLRAEIKVGYLARKPDGAERGHR